MVDVRVWRVRLLMVLLCAVIAGVGWFHVAQLRPFHRVPPALDLVQLPETFTDMVGVEEPFPNDLRESHDESRWFWVWGSNPEASDGPRLLVWVVRNASPITAWLEFRRWTFRGPDVGVKAQYSSAGADEALFRCYIEPLTLEAPAPGDPQDSPGELYCNIWSYRARFGQYRLMIAFDAVDKAPSLSDFVAVVATIESVVAPYLNG